MAISAAIAADFAQHGAAVVVHGRDGAALSAVTARIEQAGGRAMQVTADVTRYAEIEASNLSLHQLFEQQAAGMLERADLDEEQRQSILLAMTCPCCGAGGPSLSFKLKRRT